MNRLIIATAHVLLVLLVIPSRSDELTAGEQPNIVFIFIDDMGYGDLSCTGNKDVETKNIDKLAADGIRFTQFYVNSPICSPSRVAITTGQYPQRHLINSFLATRKRNRERGMTDFLDPRVPTVAKSFQTAGYATAHFGKWHMGGGRDVDNAPLPSAYGFDEHFVNFEGMGPKIDREARPKYEWTPEYINRSIDFIRRNKDQRFYLHLWLNDVHDRHDPRDDYLKKYEAFKSNPYVHRFYAVLHQMDDEIGRLIEQIEELGLAEKTLIVLTSDNGPTAWKKYYRQGFQPPGSTAGYRGRKWSLYEGGTRMPLIARWKGKIPAGTVNTATVGAAIDLFPTFCELAGVHKPTVDFDGESLAKPMLGEAAKRARPIFWEYGRTKSHLKPGKDSDISPNLAIRDGDWKLLINDDGTRSELYNFATDTSETQNVADQNPKVTKRLADRLLAWRASLPELDDQPNRGPYQATGFKIGEVDSSSAIVWTRLTKKPKRNPADAPMVEVEYTRDPSRGRRQQKLLALRFPPGTSADDLRNAAPGTSGETRVRYRATVNQNWRQTPWQAVDPKGDFTAQFHLGDLTPATTYLLEVESRSVEDQSRGQIARGYFRTAAAAEDPQPVVFAVSTGQAYRDLDRADGFNIYSEILKLDPDFFVHTGDIVYYDELAKTAALARYHWQRTYSLPTNVNFHRHVGSYFIKDDHDTFVNDCWPTMSSPYMHQFTFVEGLKIFREQVPMGKRTYRTRRWGKDLQIWLVEGRDFRSANTDPDGPAKTIWGTEQKAWLKKSVTESDATFRILISPTPIVGPDRSGKKDNHANKVFQHEGDEIRTFLSKQKNMFVVCGDRHWQYMSVDPRTKLREYSCGPASDAHAGGWKKDDFRNDYHRYLKVIGGFLSVTVDRKEQVPTITFRYHSSQGAEQFKDVVRLTDP